MSADSATFKFMGREFGFPETPATAADEELRTFYVIVNHWEDKAQPFKKFRVHAHKFEPMEERTTFWVGDERVAVFNDCVVVYADDHVVQMPPEVGETSVGSMGAET